MRIQGQIEDIDHAEGPPAGAISLDVSGHFFPFDNLNLAEGSDTTQLGYPICPISNVTVW
jgi:hypothetical protein